jgi:hypothetical protein
MAATMPRPLIHYLNRRGPNAGSENNYDLTAALMNTILKIIQTAEECQSRDSYSQETARPRLGGGVKFHGENLQLMTALLADTRELKLLSEFAESPATVTGSSRCVQSHQLNSACTMETIRVRAEEVTPVLKKLLEIRPPPHWGINE